MSPAHAREVLDAETRRVERVLLEIRLATGLPPDVLDDAGRAAVAGSSTAGCSYGRRPARAHPRGRLLADAVVRDLLP